MGIFFKKEYVQIEPALKTTYGRVRVRQYDTKTNLGTVALVLLWKFYHAIIFVLTIMRIRAQYDKI